MIRLLNRLNVRLRCSLPKCPQYFHYSTQQHKVIGIDLGTTNSAVAIVINNVPQIIELPEGERTTPLVVAYTDNGVLVGAPALRQQTLNPHNTFAATKRLVGRTYADAQADVETLAGLPYRVVPGPDNAAWVALSNGKRYPPAEIAARILLHMRHIAAEAGHKARHAVVTVPAYFDDAQRNATKEAGRRAGLDVLRVVNEPTAAALAYGLEKESGLVAVYDLGGGTFDILVLDIADGVFEVVATAGDTHLGGEDFDDAVYEYVLKKIGEPQLEPVEKARLRAACVEARVALLEQTSTKISVPFLGNINVDVDLSRAKLEELTEKLLERTAQKVQKVLSDAELEPEDIDEVVLVGGMTRMPKVQDAVSKLFPGKLVGFTVNPDEAVALGAAVQGAILSGEITNVLLLDVTPLTLGIETYGGIFAPLIPRNTTIPITKKEVFSTGVDGQTAVDILVYQGERPLVRENRLIGNFKLGNIPILPKGEPQIEVTFDIDADGILEVRARELRTGEKASITVSAGLGEEDVKRMVEEAEKNKETDLKRRVALEHATRAEMVVNDTENALIQLGGLVKRAQGETLAKVEALKDLVGEVKKQVESVRAGGDVVGLKEKVDLLSKESLKVYGELAKLQGEEAKKEETK